MQLNHLALAGLFVLPLASGCADDEFSVVAPLAIDFPADTDRSLRVVVYQDVVAGEPLANEGARVQDFCGDETTRMGSPEQWIGQASLDDMPRLYTTYSCAGERLSGPEVYVFETDECQYDNWLLLTAEYVEQAEIAKAYHPFDSGVMPVSDRSNEVDLCEGDDDLLEGGVHYVDLQDSAIATNSTFFVEFDSNN